MSDSLRQELNKHTIANDIRLNRQQHQGSFLVVEGHNDARLLKKFIDASCQLIVAFGYDGVSGAIGLLEAEDFKGIAGVVDADFSNIRNVARGGRNLIVTEFHDLDCILFLSSALSSVLPEVAKEDRIKALEAKRAIKFASIILKEAAPVGALRLVSEVGGLDLDFNVQFSFVPLGNDVETNIERLVEVILSRSSKNHLNKRELVDSIGKALSENHDLKQLCCGPDLLELWSKSLKKAIGNINSTRAEPDILRSCLRMAFSRIDFEATTIFHQMLTWQNRNPNYKIV
jgi:hypothetical protein